MEGEDSNKNSADEQGPTSPSPSSRAPLVGSLVAFSVAYFVVHIVFFYVGGSPVGFIRVQEILNMFNPLVLVPLFYRIALIDVRCVPSAAHHMIFLLAVVIYVHGDGIHLSANAIREYEDSIVDQDAKDCTYFYDEQLGHYYPYVGILLLHVIWIIRQNQLSFVDGEPFQGWASRSGLVLGGFLHGFSMFITFTEGHFAIPSLVYMVILLLYVILFQRQHVFYDPVHMFSVSYASMGILLFTIWGIWQKGFPEFSEVGII